MLGLASLHPMILPSALFQDTAATIDVAQLLRQVDRDAFRPIYPLTGATWARSEANRIWLPGQGTAVAELRQSLAHAGYEHPVLRSHAVSPEVADGERAISMRETTLAETTSTMMQRLTEWDHGDRPSIEYLLRQLGDA